MARILRADRRGPLLRPAVVLDAEARARALVEAARAEATALRERARDEGRAAGYAELAAGVASVAAARDRVLAASDAAVVDVALRVAAHLVGGSVRAEPARIADVVRPELERLRHAARVTVRVHPDDRDALVQALARLGDDEGLPRTVGVEADASVTRGGCVVESDAGTLDARLEVRLEALREALTRP